MTNVRQVFLDTNILIRSTVANAPLHNETLEVLNQLASENVELWISNQVLREYASNVTRPQTYASPISGASAASVISIFRAQFNIATETDAVMDKLVVLLGAIPMGGKQVHDANIVATMQTHGITELLTYNAVDFARFSPLIVILNPQDILHQTGRNDPNIE